MSLLLDNFKDLLSNPNAVDQFNAQILQWAVQGKLVSQDLDDEPASVLLEKIVEEKARLIIDGKLKKAKPLPPIKKDEIPYELPDEWIPLRIGDIAKNIHYGYTASANYELTEYRLLRITDIQDNQVNWLEVPGCEIHPEEARKFLLEHRDILFARTGGTVGKTYLVEEDIPVQSVFASYLIRVILPQTVNANFIKYFFESSWYWIQITDKSRGSGQPNVNANSLRSLIFLLPPLPEQYRIVEKVESLLSQTKVIKEQLIQAEEEQRKLNKSALFHLTNAKGNGDFKKHWDFIKDNFDLLYTHPENVAELKQAILQLSVQGKLVPQDPNDEPASILLEEIKEEKAKLIKEGKIRKSKSLPPIEKDDIPYNLPTGWEWVRLGEIIHVSSGESLTKEKMISTGNIPVYGGNGITGFHNKALVNKSTIVIGRVGYYCGSVHLTEENAWVTDNALIATYPIDKIYRDFLVWLLRGTNLKKNVSGSAQPVISGKKIYPLVVGLPPFAEQQRIIGKFESLFNLTVELEEEVATLPEAHQKLLTAVLGEV